MPLFLLSWILAQTLDPVFDRTRIPQPPLDAKILKSSEKDGIVTEEIVFHPEKDRDKSVDLVALFCHPKGTKKLPAFVWNQGGLGKASSYWPQFGAKRCYAVLCIDFPLPGYRYPGGYPMPTPAPRPSLRANCRRLSSAPSSIATVFVSPRP